MSIDGHQKIYFKYWLRVKTGTEDEVLEFTWAVEKKYADKKFFCTLPWGLPKDKLAMSLVPEYIPLRQEIAATITSAVGNCLFNAVLLALVGN